MALRHGFLSILPWKVSYYLLLLSKCRNLAARECPGRLDTPSGWLMHLRTLVCRRLTRSRELEKVKLCVSFKFVYQNRETEQGTRLVTSQSLSECQVLPHVVANFNLPKYFIDIYLVNYYVLCQVVICTRWSDQFNIIQTKILAFYRLIIELNVQAKRKLGVAWGYTH